MNEEQEVSRRLEEIRKTQKKKGLWQMLVAFVAFALLSSSVIAIVSINSANNTLERSIDRREARITVLENALDAQRTQFYNCRNTNTKKSPACSSAVTPPSKELKPGPPGPPGVQGLIGPPGSMGPRGPLGPIGKMGQNGLSITGTPGAAGSSGINGKDGRQGFQGNVGPAGPAGTVGSAGPAGPAGQKGAKGDAPSKQEIMGLIAQYCASNACIPAASPSPVIP